MKMEGYSFFMAVSPGCSNSRSPMLTQLLICVFLVDLIQPWLDGWITKHLLPAVIIPSQFVLSLLPSLYRSGKIVSLSPREKPRGFIYAGLLLSSGSALKVTFSTFIIRHFP